MAVLHLVRVRSRDLIRSSGVGRADGHVLPFVLIAVVVLGVTGLLLIPDSPDPAFMPDETLRAELGLGDRDVVHRVRLTGGATETSEPVELSVAPGVWVEFVTTDWHVHEIAFELDSLSSAARDFLEGSDQVASPPLLRRDSRFVISLEGAPPGRYPYTLQGNGAQGRGVVVVVEPNP